MVGVLVMLLERRLVAELLIVGSGGILSAISVRVGVCTHCSGKGCVAEIGEGRLEGLW